MATRTARTKWILVVANRREFIWTASLEPYLTMFVCVWEMRITHHVDEGAKSTLVLSVVCWHGHPL
eukprot:6467591-Amphidinium_carterae.3